MSQIFSVVRAAELVVVAACNQPHARAEVLLPGQLQRNTLVTVPGAGHFVQQDAAEFVTATMRGWLDARR